jgi:molybdate transport repressor ModE-like protein
MAATPRSIRWDDLRLLAALHATGSLLAAGRELGLSTSTVSRRLTTLEEDLGRTLLERHRGGARLTEAGRFLALGAGDVSAAIAARLRALPGEGHDVEGVVRISAGDGFADLLLGAVETFRAAHPRVRFELGLESRVVNVATGEADLALRTLRTSESTLVYRRLGEMRWILAAAPSYLAAHAAPRRAAELSRHTFVGFAPPLDRLPAFTALVAAGARDVAVRLTTFSAYALAVQRGLGLGVVPRGASPDLVPVLPQLALPDSALWLAVHRDRRKLPHVAAFAKHLEQHVTRHAPR